jgi:septum formation protein
MELVLASTSSFRREQLARLGIAFTCRAPAVSEQHLDGESAASRAGRLATEKANAVASTMDADCLVIGSDQVAVSGTRVLDKPGSTERAVSQLLACSGRKVTFHTAVCLAVGHNGARHLHIDHTDVLFRELTETEVRRYVDRDDPLNCAGSFKCESLGITLFDAIETRDPTALIGLPLIALSAMLREAGIDLP